MTVGERRSGRVDRRGAMRGGRRKTDPPARHRRRGCRRTAVAVMLALAVASGRLIAAAVIPL